MSSSIASPVSDELTGSKMIKAIQNKSFEEAKHTICKYREMLLAYRSASKTTLLTKDGLSAAAPSDNKVFNTHVDCTNSFLNTSESYVNTGSNYFSMVNIFSDIDSRCASFYMNNSKGEEDSNAHAADQSSLGLSHGCTLRFGPYDGIRVKLLYNDFQLLGHGAFAKVYRARLHAYRPKSDFNQNGIDCEASSMGTECSDIEEEVYIEVAAKESYIKANALATFDRFFSLLSVLEVICTIKHPYIITFFMIAFFPNGFTSEIPPALPVNEEQKDTYLLQCACLKSFQLLTVLELGSLGNLSTHLKNSERLSEDEIRSVLRNILSAVQYLHEVVGVVHNDIKPSNILLFPFDKQPEFGLECPLASLKYKLMDFGSSRISNPVDEITQRLEGSCQEILASSLKDGAVTGTFLYMSPEGCLGFDDSVSNDIWSIGIMVYQLATGRVPWHQMEISIPSIIFYSFRKKFTQGALLGNTFSTENNIVGDEIDMTPRSNFGTFGPVLDEFENSNYSLELCDFVRQCLEEDFRKRPTCRQLLEHSFMHVDS